MGDNRTPVYEADFHCDMSGCSAPMTVTIAIDDGGSVYVELYDQLVPTVWMHSTGPLRFADAWRIAWWVARIKHLHEKTFDHAVHLALGGHLAIHDLCSVAHDFEKYPDDFVVEIRRRSKFWPTATVLKGILWRLPENVRYSAGMAMVAPGGAEEAAVIELLNAAQEASLPSASLVVTPPPRGSKLDVVRRLFGHHT